VKGRHKPHARRDLVDKEGVDVEDFGIVTGYCGKLSEMVEAQTPCSPGRGRGAERMEAASTSEIIASPNVATQTMPPPPSCLFRQGRVHVGANAVVRNRDSAWGHRERGRRLNGRCPCWR